MPVRSSSSSVLRWPDADTVRAAVERWARVIAADEHVVQVGYFGSYARGDSGVGSDLDLVMVVTDSDVPWERRSASWDTTGLPVPADLVVYTRAEWERRDPEARFTRTLDDETRWVFVRPA